MPTGKPQSEFAGKVALVTGAARGIGRAVAIELARRGADLVLNDWNSRSETRDVAEEIEAMGRRALSCQADIAERAQCEQMFSSALATFGRLDMLVNNAAFSVREPFLELSPHDVEQTWGVAQWGAFHCSQLAARQMVQQGSGAIVMVSSVHSFRPYPDALAYNAAKAAVNHMAASMALELAGKGVRVNVVEPGWIDTPGERKHNTEAQIIERGATLPMRRLGSAQEVAKAVAFLCSEDASYVTGATLRVDGGFSLKF